MYVYLLILFVGGFHPINHWLSNNRHGTIIYYQDYLLL